MRLISEEEMAMPTETEMERPVDVRRCASCGKLRNVMSGYMRVHGIGCPRCGDNRVRWAGKRCWNPIDLIRLLVWKLTWARYAT